MPNILHFGFFHIFYNTIFALIFGSMLESMVGNLKMMYIWVLSGLAGVLFSSLLDDNPSVGASTSLMGIMGGFLAFLTINWKALKNQETSRCMLLIIIILVLVIQLSIGLSAVNADNYGHLGGLIFGYFLTLPVISILPSEAGRH